MKQAPTLDIQPERDPLATIAVSAAPVVLEGRYRLLMRALWQLRHSRRTRWGVGLGSAALMLLLALLAVRHFATTSWPLSRGQPGLLVAAGLLLLLARLGRWLSPRTTSLYRATQAWAFVFGCWLVRGVAFFILLGTLGLGYSFPLALLFLCAGAAAAALPIGPAGAATQAGAGTAALAAAGVGGSQALAASVSVGALGVFSGAVVLLFALAWRTGRWLLPARAGA
jgi:hypothetical protein